MTSQRVHLPLGDADVAPVESVEREVILYDGPSRRVGIDRVVVEEPLEIRVGGTPVAVTMRTPGHDQELAAGFLLTEGVIASREMIASIGHSTRAEDRARHNVIEIELAPGVSFDLDRLQRTLYAASSCGVCGKTSIDRLRVRGARAVSDETRFRLSVLLEMPARMRAAQTTFDATGGLHAAALFDAEGQLCVLREDVGRHNATDAVIGRALLDGRPLAGHALLVSGRAGFEIVQKVGVAGIPLLAAVSAPSSLAVELAVELGVTLVAFVRPPRASVYAHERRVVA